MPPTDDELVDVYLRSRAEAFEQLYTRYARRLLGFLAGLRRSDRPGPAGRSTDDLAQQTWMKVIEKLPKCRCRGRFGPWLFTIAHRQWLDDCRSSWQRRVVLVHGDHSPESTDPDDGPVDEAIAREQQSLLRAALDALPAAMRSTVLLRIDGQLTFRKIAKAMDCSLGTALWRMNEAQRRLAKCLQVPAEEAMR